MSRVLIVRPEAEQDITEAFSWYEERQPGLGSRFLEAVEAAKVSVARFRLGAFDGAIAFTRKPIDRQALIAAVASAGGNHSAGGKARFSYSRDRISWSHRREGGSGRLRGFMGSDP